MKSPKSHSPTIRYEFDLNLSRQQPEGSALEEEIRKCELKRDCCLALLRTFESGEVPPFYGLSQRLGERGDVLIAGWAQVARMIIELDTKLEALKASCIGDSCMGEARIA